MDTAGQRFTDVYRRYVSLVLGRALRILRDRAAAQDVTHDVFLKYIEATRAGLEERQTAPLLYRYATNLALNRLRNTRTRLQLITSNQGAHHQEPDVVEQVTVLELLRQAPMEEAEIASYYYLDGMNQQEIADLLHMERRTVGRRLDSFRERALQAVRPREAQS